MKTSLDDMLELVKNIAEEDPIGFTGNGEINICRYCDVVWAESDFASFMKRHNQLKKNPPEKDWVWHDAHHRVSCFWVRANILRIPE